ncbi:carbonic anhydrase, partial [Clohesyomyces aquaticus]
IAETLPRNQMVVIISWMDPRLSPEQFFDFARVMPVIRVAGGRAKGALDTLLVLDHAFCLGQTIVVHHTDCSMTHMTNEVIKNGLLNRCPDKATDISKMHFDEITGDDLERSVKSDVKWLRVQPYFDDEIDVVGGIFDLNTGKIEIVE